MRFINGGKPTSMEQINDWYIPRLESYANPKQGWGLWGVTLKASNNFCGWILIRPSNFFDERRDDRDLEIGWRFLRNTWGNGYATEAAAAVMDEIEKHRVCDFFSAHAMQQNEASIHVMRKLGMEFVENFQHVDGDFVADCVLYRRPARKQADSESESTE